MVLSILIITSLVHAQSKRLEFGQIDGELQALIVKLRLAAIEHDAAIIYSALAWNYKIERDFGGAYLDYENPEVNFSSNYQFDNNKMSPQYKDSGWRKFEEDITNNTFEQKESDEICSPYSAMEHKPVPLGQLCFKKNFLLGWQISKHINGGD